MKGLMNVRVLDEFKPLEFAGKIAKIIHIDSGGMVGVIGESLTMLNFSDVQIVPVISVSANIEELEFSFRTSNCLNSQGIFQISQLVVLTGKDLMKIDNFGVKCLREVKEKLNIRGLSLGMKL